MHSRHALPAALSGHPDVREVPADLASPDWARAVEAVLGDATAPVYGIVRWKPLRYMDDLIFFGDDRESLLALRDEVSAFLSRWRLRVHEDTTSSDGRRAS